MKCAKTTALLLSWCLLAGCEKPAEKPAGKDKDKPVAKDTKHDDWWCNEHGVKEEECTMCSAKAAKAAQAKGDWCKEHQRAKSQCFLCDPKLQEKFAAEYVAKYGKQPPEPDGQKADAK